MRIVASVPLIAARQADLSVHLWRASVTWRTAQNATAEVTAPSYVKVHTHRGGCVIWPLSLCVWLNVRRHVARLPDALPFRVCLTERRDVQPLAYAQRHCHVISLHYQSSTSSSSIVFRYLLRTLYILVSPRVIGVRQIVKLLFLRRKVVTSLAKSSLRSIYYAFNLI